jgi:hypothetical protein
MEKTDSEAITGGGMSRQVVWLGVALCAFAAAGWLAWVMFDASTSGVTKANCARLKPGMTLQEVEAIFAEPHSHEREIPGMRRQGPLGVALTWCGDEGVACVWFDHKGLVGQVIWEEGRPTPKALENWPPATYWERLLFRLGL